MTAQRKIDRMTLHELWLGWQADVETIRRDALELYSLRRQFREIRDIFAANTRLQELGGHIWDLLSVLYASTVLIRLRREATGDGGGVTLAQLLAEIEQRPDVIRTYRPTDTIDVAEDRRALSDATARLVKVASMTVAHRSRIAPKAALNVEELDVALDVVERLLVNYLSLLTGVAWTGVEPMPTFNTIAPFCFPWHKPFYDIWVAIPREVKVAAGLVFDHADEHEQT
jgi:hypothetical protein